MDLIGLYRPGSSWLHRLPAGTKLLGLVLVSIASVLSTTELRTGSALVVVVVAYASARIPVREALRLLRPMLFLAVPLAVFHTIVSSWQAAFCLVGTLLGLVMVANLVTLTTRSTDLIDVIVRVLGPLRRFGVAPERVGVLMLLGIRSVPVVIGLAQGIRDAQRARGLTASPRAFAVPLLVGALRHADRTGDALVARGLDDQ